MRLLFLAAAALLGCSKETPAPQPDAKAAQAWQEVTSLYGTQRMILGMSGNGTAIFLQQPDLFAALSSSSPTPTPAFLTGARDIRVRLGMSPLLYAVPFDTVVVFGKTTDPMASSTYPGSPRLSVRKVDPDARSITQTSLGTTSTGLGPFSSLPISSSNHLLLHYSTASESLPGLTTSLRFLLAAVDPHTPPGHSPRVLSAQRLVLPHSSTRTTYYLSAMASIEDYFLVAFDGYLFKIEPTGAVRQVAKLFDYNESVAALYKWQGRLYCIGVSNTLISDNDGESWQTYSPLPTAIRQSRPFPVGDSLVCAIGANLVSWRWRGATASLRVLNSTGLERSTITGLQLLRDTVYVGTTNGLFVRPLRQFFESQPQ